MGIVRGGYRNSGCDDRILMVVRLDQNAMQSNDGFLIVVLIHHKLDVHLTHALVQGQNADILVRQGLEGAAERGP